MQIMLNLRNKMSTVGWAQSVFSFGEETIRRICSNPDPETAFNVMVKRQRAEVKVSTLLAEQNSIHLSSILWWRRLL